MRERIIYRTNVKKNDIVNLFPGDKLYFCVLIMTAIVHCEGNEHLARFENSYVIPHI